MLLPANWTQIELITNIVVSLVQNQSSAKIYGNGRNCIPITVSFNGLNKQGEFINLSGHDISEAVYLVDHHTNMKLPWMDMPAGKYGVYYSNHRSKFCDDQPGLINSINDDPKRIYSEEEEEEEEEEELNEKDKISQEKTGSVTYYIYGIANSHDLFQDISLMIKLANGTYLSTYKYGASNQQPIKVSLQVWKQIRYRADDLYPMEWMEIQKEGNSTQWLAQLRLRGPRSPVWVQQEFANCGSRMGDLHYISRTTREHISYLFFVSPLGSPAKFTIDTKYGGPFTMVYNQEPGTLSVICAQTYTPFFNDVENYTDDIIIKLYDSYGNIGLFRFDWTNPIDPTLITHPGSAF